MTKGNPTIEEFPLYVCKTSLLLINGKWVILLKDQGKLLFRYETQRKILTNPRAKALYLMSHDSEEEAIIAMDEIIDLLVEPLPGR